MTTTPLAIDVGHGWTKALSATKRVYFPSLIAAAPPALDLGEYAQSNAVHINGRAYFVGEAARPYATPLWARDKASDRETLFLLMIAAASLEADGDLQLATGLPLSWYGDQRAALQTALESLPPQTIQLPKQPARTLHIVSAEVLPQAMAAAIALLSDPVSSGQSTLLIDIGYRTSDYLTIQRRPNKPPDFILPQSGTIELGMSLIAETVAVELENLYHQPFTPGEVETAPQIMMKGHAVDLHAPRQQARELLVTQLHQELVYRLKTQLDRMHQIILVGGGASVLTEPLHRLLDVPVMMATDPQWANVRGYWSRIEPRPSAVAVH